MSITLGALQSAVLQLVNRDATYQGFFNTPKLNAAINDSLDYVEDSMMAEGQGWMTQRGYLTPTAGVSTLALPTGCVLVKNVWWLKSSVYAPLTFDDDTDNPLYDSSVTTQWPEKFNVMGTNLVFNPLPTSVGPNYVQIDYTQFTNDLADPVNDTVDPQFDKALLNYVKWRSASILVSQVGKNYPDWQKYEMEWAARMREKIPKRISMATFIRDYRYE